MINGEKGLGFVIQEIHAFVAVHGDKDEGVMAVPTPGGGMMPLIGADPTRVAQLRVFAQAMATGMGIQVRLVKFSNRELVETIEP